MESQKYSTGTVQYQYDKGLPTPIPRMMPRAGMLEWRILEFDWDAAPQDVKWRKSGGLAYFAVFIKNSNISVNSIKQILTVR